MTASRKLLAQAREAIDAGRLQEADACCRRAAAGDPSLIEAHYYLGVLAAQGERFEEAAEHLARVVPLEPTLGDADFLLARVQRLLGRKAEARETWALSFQRRTGVRGDREAFFSMLPGLPLAQLQALAPQLCFWGEFLEECGYFACEGKAIPARVAAIACPAEDEDAAAQRLHTLFAALAFSKNSAVDWNRRLFEDFSLPRMLDALAAGHCGLALWLEDAIYRSYVVQVETGAHFRACFSRWIDAMGAAGRALAASYPIQTAPRGDGPPLVAFFAHSASMLAHIRVMLSYVEGFRASGEALPFRIKVYALAGSHTELERRLREAGAELILLSRATEKAPMFQRLLWLRESLAREGATALVWLSCPTMMSFAFAMRMAPVQIWWAMKYHSLELPDIDGYLTNSSVEVLKEIDGRIWRAGRGCYPELRKPLPAEEVAALRARYAPGGELILGSFGREEKLDSADFLDAVVRILREYPNTVYLWTGRQPLRRIEERLRRGGVMDRCRFIGWVDTRLYGGVLDVFLDSFPFPCGITLIQSMAAGAAFVSHASRESKETGTPGLLQALLHERKGASEDQELAHRYYAGGELFFRAEDIDSYVAMAGRLIRDDSLRRRAGSANEEFARAFFTDQARTTSSFSRHFAAIIEEALAKNGSGHA